MDKKHLGFGWKTMCFFWQPRISAGFGSQGVYTGIYTRHIYIYIYTIYIIYTLYNVHMYIHIMTHISIENPCIESEYTQFVLVPDI